MVARMSVQVTPLAHDSFPTPNGAGSQLQKWGQRKSYFPFLRGDFGGNAELMGGSFHSWCWESYYQSPLSPQHLLAGWPQLLGTKCQCGHSCRPADRWADETREREHLAQSYLAHQSFSWNQRLLPLPAPTQHPPPRKQGWMSARGFLADVK